MRRNRIFILLLIVWLFTPAASTYADNLMNNVQHGFVDNDGVNIHYATLGEGPLIVMLHGFPDFWYTWRHQMAALAKDYQVVAVDLRGYNKSDKPQGVENYTMRLLIGDVAAVIKHFPQKKAIVIGHDWGGAIAWQVAMWRPDLVEKLIVLSTPHPNGLFREIRNNPQQQENSQYARDFQKEGAHKELTAEGLAEWVTDEKAKPAYTEAFRRSDFEAMLNYYKASFPSPGSSSQNSSPTPPAAANPRLVKCPALGIFGLEDKALLASGWNETWNWVENNLTLVSIPGAGHFVQQSHPNDVTDAIVSWLGKTAGLRSSPQDVDHSKITPFDKLLGSWQAERSVRNQDGSWSDKLQKHRWQFYTILGGEAIQDDWFNIDSTGQSQIVGTNIRIFNPKENQWHMSWIDKNNRRNAVFTAKTENGTVIMDGSNAKGRPVRNTFFNITSNSFDWKQQWTFDNGKNWIEVARLKCVRE